jgi:hypothetical protein
MGSCASRRYISPRSDSVHEGTQDPLHHLHLPPTSKLLGRGSRQGRVMSASPHDVANPEKRAARPCRPCALDRRSSTARAELLHVLMLPDLERADRIGEFWGYPDSRSFSELLIDCEEDRFVHTPHRVRVATIPSMPSNPRLMRGQNG